MRYVIIGSSAAGVNAVRELRKLSPKAEIVLISKDENIYSRCILHEYLAGKRSLERLCFVEADFANLYRIQWMKGREAVGLDRENKAVILENGERVSYDKLLIATGSHTFFPPIKNMAGSPNMAGFRNIDDIEILKKAALTKKNIVVLGSGLVGIDCATGFLEQGVKCAGVVNEVKVHELDTQLDEDVRKKKPLFSRYVYVVSYTDPEGQEKTTETYEVMHPDKEAAGKQCIVYTLDGKCFVDAIEKKTEGGNKHEEHGGNISADEG